MDLRLRTRHRAAQSSATVVEVAGEIDLYSAPGLRAELGRAVETSDSAPRIVVDLSGVTFLDSTGVGVLVGALKGAREAGGQLALCSAQARVRRVFEITGLIGALPLFDARGEALEFLASFSDAASALAPDAASPAEQLDAPAPATDFGVSR